MCPGWVLGDVVVTHNAEPWLFTPPGLLIIHIYASESRLFSQAAAIRQPGQEPSITWDTVHFHESQCWRIFCLDVPAMAKTATQRQKVLLKQLHKHEIWKSSRGLHGP